jgi:hypothetical protein
MAKKRKHRTIKRRDRIAKPVIKRRRIKRRDNGVYRRRKFKRSKRNILLAALRKGISIKRSCGLAGIGETTYRNWLEIGKDPNRPTYRYFRKQVKQIEAQIEKEALDVIKRAFTGGAEVNETKYIIGAKGTQIIKTKKEVAPSWQAAAWRLERKFFREYGRNKELSDIGDRTPEEMAQDIKAAADMLFNTVPSKRRKKLEHDIPKDMPD